MAQSEPINPTDDEARALAKTLLEDARHGVIGVQDFQTGAPHVARVGVARHPDGQPMTLVSELSHHTTALRVEPRCALLVGEPGEKGDPLNHPRMTLACRAVFIEHGTPDYAILREVYLSTYPKAKLYIDFTDFSFAVLLVTSVELNGGFGKAYRLMPEDLGLDPVP
ncbi:MAG: pyridoxamine 5'-phosphate oxidase family protein [Pseudomonadota bacterium]